MSSCGSHSHAHSHAHTEPSSPLPQISVNGKAIREEDLANELQYHPNKDFEVVVQQAGQTLVIRELLHEEARKRCIEISAENEEEALQQLIGDSISYEDPREDDCLRYFANNPDKFTTMPLMEVDHILLAAAPDDVTGRETAKNQAKRIIDELKNDPLLFPSLAQQYSACPSKETGGNLGQLSKGQTVPEFERQLMPLKQGLAESPIESRYGFHVVNITRKIEGKKLEYSMVADKVRGYLTHRVSHLAIQEFIQSLVEQAEIEGVEIRFAEENIHI
ncbi:peptidylprolyl isomerase [Aliikangiella sp. G2MR2-5]|uniref:peptidylprolyl isomerase n=1 Tax=Aliikangiella sp. G2MR2-5 TaxID=2788943 RepID=UPI0018A9AB78|nr:peptidylprolyl isomerase [Aliikangiella sp. G2MR2-5]